ncbi:MAG TPA: hypothetical protein VMX17_05550 [Candidatus Glassbacteria bacterium]|nr:hypothetical protein [Candidatus Glassbacteria bacterium]
MIKKKKKKKKIDKYPIEKVDRNKTYTFLGFDISSSTIGYASITVKDGYVLDVDCDYYKPNKKPTTIMSLVQTQKDMSVIINKMQKKAKAVGAELKVAVEDFLLAHSNTSAQSITLLAIYNAAVCLSIHSVTQVDPRPIPVATIRAKLRRLSGIKDISKELVPDIVEEIINNRKDGGWILEQYVGAKGGIIVENYDIADGIGVALAYAYETGALC